MTTELTNAVDALNDVTQKHEQLNTQYQSTHDALTSNSQAMTDWQTQQGTVELTDQNGNKHPTPTLKTLVEQAQSVNPHPHAMTKAQFDALRDIRKQQYAGSGFVEWGKHFPDSVPTVENINQGLFTDVAKPNILIMGDSNSTAIGDSRTGGAISIVDGVELNVKVHGVWSNNLEDRFTIEFPPAPDGTKTYDSATGAVTQHNNAEVAFASETATNKVITSRKDLVFLESWHEKIADKDVVYPLGNVQFGASSYEGVTLLNNLVAQGYSAFGEWDENTQGYGVKWSSLTDAQKALFLSEPEHNIYFDPQANAYIQVRYRIRVVEGSSDIWPLTSPTKNDYFLAGEFKSHVAPQGNLIVSKCLTPGYPVFLSTNRGDAVLKHDNHIYGAVDSNNSNVSIAHNGKCFALPIALVQRMNQGAYHPVYNPMGCAMVVVENGSSARCWWDGRAREITSTNQAFTYPTSGYPYTDGFAYPDTGLIGGVNGYSGRQDQYKYHDAIYAGQVEDLRLNANKLDVNKLREDAMRKAVAGEMRGKGKVPFTQVQQATQGATVGATNAFDGLNTANISVGDKAWLENASNVYERVTITSVVNNSGTIGFEPSLSGRLADSMAVLERELSPEFDSLPWVDIFGNPERIAATFPNGVVGQWIPHIPVDGGNVVNLNKKYSTTAVGNFTYNDGATWGIFPNFPVNSRTNSRTGWSDSNGSKIVYIISYESPSNFTEPSINSVVVGSVRDIHYTTHHNLVEGNRLQGSLTGGIGKATTDPAQTFTPNLGGYEFRGNGEFNEYFKYPVKTGEVPLAPQGNNSPAVKTLSTITEKNGLYYLQLHGAELKYTPRTIADMTVITAGSATGPITKGKVYLLKGFDNGLINKPIIAIESHVGTTWRKHDFDGYTINSIGQVIDSLDNVSSLLRAFECHWGDDQTIPIIDGENVKTDLNGNTVKVFCHHSQIPLGIAHND